MENDELHRRGRQSDHLPIASPPSPFIRLPHPRHALARYGAALPPLDAALGADLASIGHSRHGHRLARLLTTSRSAIRWTAWARWCRPSSAVRFWPSVSAAGNIRTGAGGEIALAGFCGRGPPAGPGRDGRRAIAAAGARRVVAAVADSRRALLLQHRPLARHDAAISRRPQGVGRADRGPRGGDAAISPWPATLITASAFPTASTAANWRPSGFSAGSCAMGRTPHHVDRQDAR